MFELNQITLEKVHRDTRYTIDLGDIQDWANEGYPGQWILGDKVILELAYEAYVAWGGEQKAVPFGRGLKQLIQLSSDRVRVKVNGKRYWGRVLSEN